MRASLPVTLISLLLPSLAAASAARSACLHLRSDDLAEASACGNKAVLRNCLASASGDVSVSVVEGCFVKAGCTPSGSETEAAWIIQFCDGEADELRRRRPVAIPDPTPEPVPAPVPQAPTSAAAPPATKLVCSTQTTTVIETCATDNKFQCSTTAVPTMVCAEGLLCMIDKAGNNLCMRRQDNLTTSGAVVAIFLAVIMTLTISSIIFLCCRDRRSQKAARAKAEAAAIAKANALHRPQTSQPAGPPPANPFNDPSRAG